MRQTIYRESGLVISQYPSDFFPFAPEAFSVELKRVPRVIPLRKMIFRTGCNCCFGEGTCSPIALPDISENRVKTYFFKVGQKMDSIQIRDLYRQFGGIADPLAQFHINSIDKEFAEEFPSCSSFVEEKGEQVFTFVYASSLLKQRNAEIFSSSTLDSLHKKVSLGSEFWLTMVTKDFDLATYRRY